MMPVGAADRRRRARERRNMIQIHYLEGPDKGLHTTFNETSLTFGRAAGNGLVIDMDVLSRQHGELRFEGDDLLLINNSPNGTTVNGKAVGKKPVKLKGGDVIGVGKANLFVVQFSAAQAAARNEEVFDFEKAADPNAAAGAKGMSKRTKLWTAIAVYMGIILAVFIFIATMGDNKPKNSGDLSRPLSAQEIEAELTRKLTLVEDPAKAARHLEEANAKFARKDSRAEWLYECHLDYKLSLAYSGKANFTGQNHLQFSEVEKEVVEKIKRDYESAYAELQSGKYRDALTRFEQLARMIASGDAKNVLNQKVNQHISDTRKNLPKR